MKRALGVLLAAAVLPATASAAQGEHGSSGLAAARQAHGATRPPATVAGGEITVEPTEGLAGEQRTVRVTLASGAPPVSVDYPGRFQARAINGRAYVKGQPAGTTLSPDERSATIDVSGLPAGTYSLPVRRGGQVLGTAVFRLYAQRREGGEEHAASGPFGPLDRNPIDSSSDLTEESETFIAVDAANTQRFATFGNDIEGTGLGGLAITDDGGTTFSHPSFPVLFDIPGSTTAETEKPTGDPILAADPSGNIWAGGLSVCTTTNTHSHIFVNRMAAGADDFGAKPNVALPLLDAGGKCGSANEVIQDKPQMTIDNTATSPTFGRLYVTWDDPAPLGGVNEVISYCDTRPGGTLNAANCDNADNWKTPTVISDASSNQGGSYITSDPTVGPDGKVYVAWWDYSSANAVRIDMCDPTLHAGACNASGDWGTDQIIASLSIHNGLLVPFACPTLAQPGGRAAPVPSLATDHGTGRIYAAWGDLSSAGSHRCAGLDDPPDGTQDTFKAYVASAPDYATLTADPATKSFERGTNVIGDAGDHWFPWVAVDQSTDQAYVDLYSTRDDPTRQTAKFYLRAVVPGDGSTRVSYGPLTVVSPDASDYSGETCCGFGNDYGDYEGLDAAGGKAYPVWTQRPAGSDGDVFLNPIAPDTGPTEVPADEAIGGPPPPPPPPPTTTTTTTTPPPTTTTTTTTPPVDRKPPVLRVTYGTRVDRKGRYTIKLAATGEAASGTAVLRLATGGARKLASGLLATTGHQAFKVVVKLRRKDLLALRRKHKLRVRLTLSLTDLAGNSARGAKTFTLRPSR